MLPAMVIEDANLANGLKRATYIAKSNLLLIGISTVGVGWITGAIGFVLAIIGLLLGGGLAFIIISLGGTSVPVVVVAVVLGVLLGSIPFMIASVITRYTSTAYHTCLFLWARDVEKAQSGQQQTGIPVQFGQVGAPAPLAAVLGQL